MNEKDSEDQTLSVYFNSACPVCNAGIHSQKSKSTACAIEWKDVHVDNGIVGEINQELSVVRKYLHVSDSKGRNHVGIHAFILLWQKSPHEHWKARVFSLPLIRFVSQCSYYIFANILYAWNKVMKNW